MVLATRPRWQADGDLLTAPSAKAIEALMADVQRLAAGDDAAAIDAAVKALADGTEAFAARAHEPGHPPGLAGRRLEEV
jgi:molecular chaperone HscA